MEQKIHLLHPAGKKAVSIKQEKYDILKKAILNFLRSNGESSHTEILHTISEDFKKNNIKFDGSLDWYIEWVKLDLEARKKIKRNDSQTPVKFAIG